MSQNTSMKKVGLISFVFSLWLVIFYFDSGWGYDSNSNSSYDRTGRDGRWDCFGMGNRATPPVDKQVIRLKFLAS